MMEVGFLFTGLALGLSIAAPVGPVGVLCIRRTLAYGRPYGFVSGLGAATADAIYGAIGALGLNFVSGLLIDQQMPLRLVGGLFLWYLGIRTFMAAPSEQTPAANASGLLGAYLSTLALTLTNPLTILSFAAIFAGLGLGSAGGDYAIASHLVAGVFLGSALWWAFLSSGVGLFRGRLSSSGLRWLNRISGAVIVGFGLAALLSLI